MGSVSELVSILDSWKGNWNGTVPENKTTTDERVIGLAFGTSSDIDLSYYDFSKAAGRRRVTLRMVGSFSTSGIGNDTTVAAPYVLGGVLNLTRAKNIRVTLCQFNGSERIVVAGSEDVTIERNYLRGSFGDWTAAEGAPTEAYGFRPDPESWPTLITRRLIFRENLVQGFQNAGIQLWGNLEDSVIEGNVLDIMSHDDFKLNNGMKKNIVHRNNWGSRVRSSLKKDFHEDFMQWESTKVENWLSEGNVIFRGPWYGLSGGVYQGFFGNGSYGGGVTVRGARFENNILVTNTFCVDFVKADLKDITVHDNLCLAMKPVPGNGKSRTDVSRGVTQSDRNIVTTSGNRSRKEPNGILINVGKSNDFGAELAYISVVPSATGMIDTLYPVSGSALDWNYPGVKAGAWRRLKAIFVEGDHPENVGWPVAPIWHARWNANASPLLPTTYTGDFDADGNNR